MCQLKEEGGMRFKDMGQFNIALLAKQKWRFITKPNSLISRVFKAKYFPISNFMHANLGNNPSYVWKSI